MARLRYARFTRGMTLCVFVASCVVMFYCSCCYMVGELLFPEGHCKGKGLPGGSCVRGTWGCVWRSNRRQLWRSNNRWKALDEMTRSICVRVCIENDFNHLSSNSAFVSLPQFSKFSRRFNILIKNCRNVRLKFRHMLINHDE